MRGSTTIAKCAAGGVALALLVAPTAANAQDITLKLDPAVAIPLNAPQSDIYHVGYGAQATLLFSFARWLDVGPTTSFLALPSATSGGDTGVAWGFGPSIRIHRPHRGTMLSPWLGVDGLYVRTGDWNRLGFSTAVGVSIPLDRERAVWAGPFVRYMQTVQPAREGYDNADAKILLVGVSLEMGTQPRHHHHDPDYYDVVAAAPTSEGAQ